MVQRVAVVTGAARGLGAAIAARLGQAGCAVAVVDLNIAGAESVADRLTAAGATAKAYKCDVTDRADVEACIDAVEADFGPLDILVSNAGITRDNLLFKMSDSDWHDVIATNLTAAFYLSRRAQASMVKKRYGKIVFISSRAIRGARGQINYAAAKAGLVGMMRSMSMELGPFGINVNAVAPGHIETEMTHATAERMGLSYAELSQSVIDRNAIKRVGQPEDVANAVAYLVSDEASYVTGQVHYLTGRPIN